MTLSLFDDPKPPTVPGIDLRCCDVAEILAEARGARLVHADPPWRYSQEPGDANPDAGGHYPTLDMPTIASYLDSSFTVSAPSARLVCWYTWPTEDEWRNAGHAGKWGARVSGGSWTKAVPTARGGVVRGPIGVGYHWRGEAEPVGLYTKGATGRPGHAIRNGHVSPPGDHSEKPEGWLREMLLAWTDPGDLVVDLFAGLAPMARACHATGRRYIGAEIDPDRHHQAMCRLALARE